MFDQAPSGTHSKVIVAAICHAPWLLVETGIVKGLTCHVLPARSRPTSSTPAASGRICQVVTGPGPRHQPAPRRPRRLLSQADRGDRRGPPRAPRGLGQFQEEAGTRFSLGIAMKAGRPATSERHHRFAAGPSAPLRFGAVEHVEVDPALHALRQAGAGILPEHEVAAGIDLRGMLRHGAQPERVVLEMAAAGCRGRNPARCR